MEFIIIDGERVAIPREVIAESREAVAAWIAEEVARRAGGAAPAVEEKPIQE